MATLKQNIRLSQLDGLRGLFALMVALYHFSYQTEVRGIAYLSNFMVAQGDLFVDFFFVLSGFVITLTYYKKLSNFNGFTDYLRKRFIRLYPLLFYTALVFLAFLLLAGNLFPAYTNNRLSTGDLFIELLNTLLLLNSTGLLSDAPGINYPSWSISSEMISYVIFGLLVVFTGKKSQYAAALILVACAAFLISIDSYMEKSEWGFVRGLLCFITGYYSFLAYKRFDNVKIPSLSEYVLTLMLILIFYVRYSYNGNFTFLPYL